MRIGILTNYHLEKVGGAEEALDRLATLWMQSGEQVVLFSSPPRDGWKGKTRPWNPTYPVERPRRPWSTTFGLGRLVRDLRSVHTREPFDLLFACDAYWPGHVARLFSQRTSVRFVVCSQGSDIMEGSRFLKSGLKRHRITKTLEAAHGIICISSYMQSRVHVLSKPRGQMTLIPNGWPDEWMTQPPTSRSVAIPYILGMGRLIALKGFQTLIEAYGHVAKSQLNVGLVIAGDGDYRPQLETDARNTGLPVVAGNDAPSQPPPWVWFTGFIHGEQKRSIVQHASLGVVPSIRQEPLALTMQELLCSSVPVVASRVGGNPDIVKPGINGELFEARDANALAMILSRLLGTRDELARLAAQANRSVMPYRWSLTAQRYLEFFREVRAM